MNVTSPPVPPTSAALDYLVSALAVGVLTAVASTGLCGLWPLHPALRLAVPGVLLAAHLAHHVRCQARPPRVRSLAGFLWAPLGRIRRIPAGTPLLAAKRYHFTPSQAYRPMLVWMGWWNCSSFPADPSTEYCFASRLTGTYALPTADLVPNA